MSNTTLHWEFRAALRHFRPDGTLAVYMAYILHANIRGRAWPSTNLLIVETGWGRASVVAAKKWLVDNQALERVEYNKRVGADEIALHQRLDIMQITGVIRLDHEVIPLLYFNQRTNEPVNSMVSESMVSESMVAEPKVVTTPKGINKKQGRGIPTPPLRKKPYLKPDTRSIEERYAGWEDIES